MSGLSDSPISIRPARENDLSVLHQMIRQLAEFERLTESMTASEDDLREAMFSASSNVEAIIGWLDDKPVGFALYFTNYSTFVGRPGLYLEDIFVVPERRGQGIGTALIMYLARIAKQRDYGRMELVVLEWNEKAKQFYRGIGANILDDWQVARLDRPAIEELAGSIS